MFLPYIGMKIKIIVDTSDRAHFKDNLMLIKLLNKTMPLKSIVSELLAFQCVYFAYFPFFALEQGRAVPPPWGVPPPCGRWEGPGGQ